MSGNVTVHFRGMVFSGTYTIAQQFITVSCGKQQKTAVLCGMQPTPIARMLLWHIAREHHAALIAN
jgi:hypothetical protein